jgi:hypothetical protein
LCIQSHIRALTHEVTYAVLTVQAAADIAEFLGGLKAKYAPTTSSSNAELSVAAVKAAFNAFAERYTDLTNEQLKPYFQFAQRVIQQLYALYADAADNMIFVLKVGARVTHILHDTDVLL